MKKQYGRQLEETIDLAMRLYQLPSIIKEGHEELEHVNECEYFKKADGTYLRGYPVHSTTHLIEKGAERELTFSKEIYLTENGTLQKFYSYSEWPYCESCKKTHSYIHREIAKDQTLTENELEKVEGFITNSFSFNKKSA
ncbi:hypothetical protein [Bacillus niameyensis]|uniref:hypothetical protein n=1 Tax=Bacillus niameyensis TaxID=1522308 RepID=UPI0007807983|nr:hypothetical protein [Bacillus niameyensis]